MPRKTLEKRRIKLEITRVNAVGSIMHHEELGRQGGGRLFYSCNLGGRVLGLNEALSEVRGQGAEPIPSVGVARLQAHYQELEQVIEAARDRLGALIECCHKGATGRFREALEGMKSVSPAAAGTP